MVCPGESVRAYPVRDQTIKFSLVTVPARFLQEPLIHWILLVLVIYRCGPWNLVIDFRENRSGC